MKCFFPVTLVLAALISPFAHANDGSVTWGDAPQLTKSHASVEMQSEIVRLIVGRKGTTVDCRFVFVNHGPACTVRMGFPDHSDDEEDHDSAKFKSFRSWVNGREVATRSAPGPIEDGFRVNWRVKAINFGARGTPAATRRVRDVYTVDSYGDAQLDVSVASYTLHTGSSWRGPIGRSEIIVSFPQWRGPFRPIAHLRADSEAAMKRFEAAMKPTGTIAYQGPGPAKVEGKSLRWIRTKWRPTLDDDIQIYFRL